MQREAFITVKTTVYYKQTKMISGIYAQKVKHLKVNLHTHTHTGGAGGVGGRLSHHHYLTTTVGLCTYPVT